MIASVSTIYPSGYYNSIDITGLLGDGITPVFDTVWIQRNNPDGSVVTIRNGDHVTTGGVDEIVIIDYEAPLNVGVSYNVTAIRHNMDGSTTTEVKTSGYFSDPAFVPFNDAMGGAVNWAAGANTTQAYVTTPVHSVGKSIRLTSTAAGDFGSVMLTGSVVQAGKNYHADGWLMSAAALVVKWQFDWYTSTGAFVSSTFSAATTTLTASLWQKVSTTQTAPAGVGVNGKVIVSAHAAATAGAQLLYFDDFHLGSAVTVGAVTLPFNTNTVLVKSLANPTLSLELTLSAMDAPQYPVRQQVNPIIGAEFPVVISDVVGARTGTFTFLTQSLDERTAFKQLFAAGATLFFQGNSDPVSGDGFEDMYFLPGSFGEGRPAGSSRDADRLWTIPYTEVGSPAGLLTTVPNNSWLVVSTAGTWQNVLTSRVSWLDVLNNPF